MHTFMVSGYQTWHFLPPSFALDLPTQLIHLNEIMVNTQIKVPSATKQRIIISRHDLMRSVKTLWKLSNWLKKTIRVLSESIPSLLSDEGTQ